MEDTGNTHRKKTIMLQQPAGKRKFVQPSHYAMNKWTASVETVMPVSTILLNVSNSSKQRKELSVFKTV